MAVAGASRFLGAATLANTRGLAAQSPTLLGEGSAQNILDSARNLAVPGFGISSTARSLNQQLLSNSATVNSLFSFAAGADATIENAQTLIKGLSSKYGSFIRNNRGAVSAYDRAAGEAAAAAAEVGEAAEASPSSAPSVNVTDVDSSDLFSTSASGGDLVNIEA